MQIGAFTATATATGLHFECCPNWTNGACDCPRDDSQQPDANGVYPLFPAVALQFGSLPDRHAWADFGPMPAGYACPTAPAEWLAMPDPNNPGSTRTQAEWAALAVARQYGLMCLLEAIRLVKHHLAQAQATTVAALQGVAV